MCSRWPLTHSLLFVCDRTGTWLYPLFCNKAKRTRRQQRAVTIDDPLKGSTFYQFLDLYSNLGLQWSSLPEVIIQRASENSTSDPLNAQPERVVGLGLSGLSSVHMSVRQTGNSTLCAGVSLRVVNWLLLLTFTPWQLGWNPAPLRPRKVETATS